MNSTTIDILDDLVRQHRFSAVRYLHFAEPWTNDPHAQEVIAQIAEMQEATADRLEQLILERDGPLPIGDFSIEFTSWHDLDLCYLLGRTIAYQQSLIAALRKAVDALDDDPEAQALVEESLGEAKGHLESLQELQGTTCAA